MDKIIEFATTEQSKRSHAFIFFWRIIMAILLSNHFMNKMDYHFVNSEIKLNTLIDFIFSQSFIYASIFYLIFIFIFFWAFKFLSFILTVFVFYKLKPMSSQSLNDIYLSNGYFKLGENNQIHIKNRKKYDELQVAADAALHWIGSDARDKLYSYVNVLFSTYIFWFYCAYPSFNFPFFVDKILLIVTIISIIIILVLDIVSVPFSSLQQRILELRRVPFYEEINP
jgi:hypothetical protein